MVHSLRVAALTTNERENWRTVCVCVCVVGSDVITASLLSLLLPRQTNLIVIIVNVDTVCVRRAEPAGLLLRRRRDYTDGLFVILRSSLVNDSKETHYLTPSNDVLFIPRRVVSVCSKLTPSHDAAR